MIHALKHADFVEEVVFTLNISLLYDLKRSVLLQDLVLDALNAAKGAFS